MQRFIIVLILMAGFLSTSNAQSNEVEITINNLFKGMLDGDSSLVHSTFHDEVSMYTTYIDDQGINQVRKGSLESFLKAVGTPHDEAWNEVISGLHIEVDDGLAQAWMNYSFYRGDQFSHCGVNTMQLVRVNQKWKILHLIDTRRKDNCTQ